MEILMQSLSQPHKSIQNHISMIVVNSLLMLDGLVADPQLIAIFGLAHLLKAI